MRPDPAPHERAPPRFLRSRWAIGALVMGAVAGWFLLSEHRAHALAALPYLLLLACPLMHVFMHGSHRSHGGHGDGSEGAGTSDTRNEGRP